MGGGGNLGEGKNWVSFNKEYQGTFPWHQMIMTTLLSALPQTGGFILKTTN